MSGSNNSNGNIGIVFRTIGRDKEGHRREWAFVLPICCDVLRELGDNGQVGFTPDTGHTFRQYKDGSVAEMPRCPGCGMDLIPTPIGAEK